jgi:hypothetical protein
MATAWGRKSRIALLRGRNIVLHLEMVHDHRRSTRTELHHRYRKGRLLFRMATEASLMELNSGGTTGARHR